MHIYVFLVYSSYLTSTYIQVRAHLIVSATGNTATQLATTTEISNAPTAVHTSLNTIKIIINLKRC